VPLLRATDPVPRQPQRVLVAGTSGAGKTTLARAVAGILGCPHVELDALYHGPGWTQRAEFVAEVDLFSAGPA
jgi:adenylate kinase family enzyme